MFKKGYKKTKISKLFKYSTFWQNTFVIAVAFVLISSLSIGYSLLRENFGIEGKVVLRADGILRIDNFKLASVDNGAIENYNSYYTEDEIGFSVTLPNLNSTVTYDSVITNYSNKPMKILGLTIDHWSSSVIRLTYQGLPAGTVINPGESINFSVSIHYDNNLIEIPDDTSINAILSLEFEEYVPVIEQEYLNEFNECSSFTVENATASCSDGILYITSTAEDPKLTFNLSEEEQFNPSKYKYAVVKYRISSAKTQYMEFFMISNPVDGTYSVTGNLISDGNWRLFVYDLSNNANIASLEKITGFRFDPIRNSGVGLEIDYIKFTDDPEIKYAYYEDFNSWDATSYSGLNYSINSAESYVTLTSTNSDPQIKFTLQPDQYFDLRKYRYVFVRYNTSNPSATLGKMQFFLNVEAESHSIFTTTLYGNCGWAEAIFDIGQNSTITSTEVLKFFRFDFTTTSEITMNIDYIKFSEVVY